ncbi:SPOR domain-containing protein [Sphingomonas sp. Leaf343]|uniref:SPOR domain-containing protein n=1 Tax=Sphingomonas sp. Leaf343 TaxID=1736345 RepID=UPI000700F273|nr:SPOR domain-containing protein [Sphingomonas sp. Leaf343]KQR83334.1 sporulation protein [Sphingomonas sp. Leaf343]
MKTLLPLALFALAVTPAGADVKAGVDAWGRGDYTRAVQEWRGPAIQGDPDAQFNLAQAYKLGRGVSVDPAQAESWFRKAADQGHQQAQDNYGLALFQSGHKELAAPWLFKSADRGEARAQLVLGTMLFNGDGVPRDYPRAYALMTRASQAGLQSAGTTLAQMDQYISAEDRQRGMTLAQEYAAGSVAPNLPGVAVKPVKTVKTEKVASAVKPVAIPPSVLREPAPRSEPKIAAKPVAKTGAWRVQLGAFRDRGNAEGLWAQMRGKLGGAGPAYVTGGGVTRLQATGFADKAEAQRACKTVAASCVVVAP